MSLSEAEANRYNELYRAGMNLIRGRIFLDKMPMVQDPWPWDRWRLRRGIKKFQSALAIAPQQWQCHFWVGKALQRLNEQREALESFEKARQLEPNNTSIAKEAANAATALGQFSLAVAVLRPAALLEPGDASLHHNLALALLLMNESDEASIHVKRALVLDPHVSSRHLEDVIGEVRLGRRSCPHSIEEYRRGA